jgi:hypothetical protein
MRFLFQKFLGFQRQHFWILFRVAAFELHFRKDEAAIVV